MRIYLERTLILATCIGCVVLNGRCASAQKAVSPTSKAAATSTPAPDKNTAASPAVQSTPQPPLTYAMPKTNDVGQLGEFLSQFLDYRPTTPEQAAEYEEKAPALMDAVAKRITQLEKDANNPVHRFASKYLLAMRLVKLDKTTGPEKVAIYKEIQANLTRADLDADDIDIAIAFADGLQTVGELRLAAQAYSGFGKTLAQNKEPLVVELAKTMEATSRRLQLPGSPIKVAGTRVDGRPFNWESYRGKVVLIDFWATWCGPCLAELPNVEKLLAQYGQQGFEVVSISMDEDRAKLDAFLAKKPLPWVVLNDEGGKNLTAEYYGVNAVPTAILVDRSGNVVSLMARGKQLEDLVTGLMTKTASR